MASAEATKLDTASLAQQVTRRNEFDREQFTKSWTTIFMLAGALAVSLILNVLQVVMRERPQNYAVTPDLRVLPLTPLSDLSVSTEGIRQWAARVIPSAYDLNFAHLQEQLAALEPSFTKEGYRGFLEGVKRAGLDELIRKNNFVVSAVPISAPQITQTGVVGGAAAWTIKMPILVTYQSASNTTNQSLLVQIVAKRVPETQNGIGIAIHSLIATRQ